MLCVIFMSCRAVMTWGPAAKDERPLDDTGDLGESVTSEPGMALEKSCRENPHGILDDFMIFMALQE